MAAHTTSCWFAATASEVGCCRRPLASSARSGSAAPAAPAAPGPWIVMRPRAQTSADHSTMLRSAGASAVRSPILLTDRRCSARIATGTGTGTGTRTGKECPLSGDKERGSTGLCMHRDSRRCVPSSQRRTPKSVRQQWGTQRSHGVLPRHHTAMLSSRVRPSR
jgi:hypothetical protein